MESWVLGSFACTRMINAGSELGPAAFRKPCELPGATYSQEQANDPDAPVGRRVEGT